MRKFLLVVVLLNSLLASSSFAGTMGPIQLPERTWVSTLSIGPVWEDGGRTQTFLLAPEIEKTYLAYKSRKALVNGELFLGIQKSVFQQLQGQLGIAVAATNNARLRGEIWDDADPIFNNHIYRYQIQHSRITVKGKLLADRGYWLTPWLSGSLGVGFNNAHDYQNRPLISAALPNPNFGDNTKTAFSYTVGVGLQKSINTHWQVGVGYEFADWGKSELNRALGQVYGRGLALNHFYTNGLLFSLSYLA
ncbi:MAG: porin family protein [Tatlockia sp.]|nr:porin family protein [Tatlockia sp.]